MSPQKNVTDDVGEFADDAGRSVLIRVDIIDSRFFLIFFFLERKKEQRKTAKTEGKKKTN